MVKEVQSAKKIHGKLTFMTRTAALITLLIVSQAVTAPLGNTLVTGSIVNALLAISVLTCGPVSGLCVALISPVIAKLFQIGPLWSIIPFIALGNAVFVLLWWLIRAKTKPDTPPAAVSAATVIAAAVTKFLVLFIGVTKIAVPLLLDLPEKQAGVISAMFSVPQLVTALVGGIIALIIYSAVKIAVKPR